MKVDTQEKRNFYKKIPIESYDFIRKFMNWKTVNTLSQSFSFSSKLGDKTFYKINQAFEQWKSQTHFTTSAEDQLAKLSTMEDKAINGGKYQLAELSTSTYEFLEITKPIK